MNNYKTIKYLIEQLLIEISERHARRKAHQLYKNSDPDVIVIKNDKGLSQYLIHLNGISKFQRKRKKTENKYPKILYFDLRKIPKPVIKYDINICLNFKSGASSYDQSFYQYVAKSIFELTNKDMYFVIEKDSESYFHLHIGMEGLNEFKDIKSKIQEYLWDTLYLKNEVYHTNGEPKRTIYIEPMVSDYANRAYLSKGDDDLGGVKPIFLYGNPHKNVA